MTDARLTALRMVGLIAPFMLRTGLAERASEALHERAKFDLLLLARLRGSSCRAGPSSDSWIGRSNVPGCSTWLLRQHELDEHYIVSSTTRGIRRASS